MRWSMAFCGLGRKVGWRVPVRLRLTGLLLRRCFCVGMTLYVGEDNGKDEIQGSLHCAADDETVRCFGRDDVCGWVE